MCMRLIMTNEILDQRLTNRRIKRLGNCSNCTTPILFLCLVENCNHEWFASPNNISRGTGCPKCFGTLSLNNQIIDDRIKERNIQRIENYINSHTSILFKCLVFSCNLEWKALPSNILNKKSGCPKCSNRLILNNQIIDERLSSLNIKRIGDYINGLTKIDFRCLITTCNYIWKTTANNIIFNLSGCPKCANHLPLTNEIIDQKLKERNIIRIGDCAGGKEKILFKCLIEQCQYKWLASPSKIIIGRGCPHCADNMPLTNEIIDARLLGRPLKRLSNYISNVNTYFQCLVDECAHVWQTKLSNILNGGGCPICNIPGYNEKLLVNTLKKYGVHFEHEFNIKQINNTVPNGYRLDIYYPQFRLAIELNGKQHYQPSAWGNMTHEKALERLAIQQARDHYIDQFCKDNDIHLIWIDGRKYSGIKLTLLINETIIPLIKSKLGYFK